MKITHSMKFTAPLMSIGVSSDCTSRAIETSNGIIFGGRKMKENEEQRGLEDLLGLGSVKEPQRRVLRPTYFRKQFYVLFWKILNFSDSFQGGGMRDGHQETVDFDKITARLNKLSYGLSSAHCDPSSSPSRIKIMHKYVDKRSGQKASLIVDDVYEIIMKKMRSSMTDFDCDYFGFKTLERSYLLKVGRNIVVRPQHIWMRVAVGIHKDDIDSVVETYHLMSQCWFTHATPTLFNAGTTRPQEVISVGQMGIPMALFLCYEFLMTLLTMLIKEEVLCRMFEAIACRYLGGPKAKQTYFRLMYYHALKSSSELAAKNGPYETYLGSPVSKMGLRCSQGNDLEEWDKKFPLVAPMPTVSTNQILGNQECFEPYASNIHSSRVLRTQMLPNFALCVVNNGPENQNVPSGTCAPADAIKFTVDTYVLKHGIKRSRF
ncbi:hypothetical protein GH714_025090 [Hevea brasiliensis]|uniref:Ribonucleoside-diphosphate reductase n=1 Tax=Hevea brasiliensis TaxID=3981 RepID=A0A6A6LBY9_HEVBR|nr:hypothetical protein GH714_025090 [Hevea brasiliensis]